ncbi:MAG: heme-binding protein [Rhodospirillales bacterium]|nr:heme-binding protein [Rhodospirillales bacterium]
MHKINIWVCDPEAYSFRRKNIDIFFVYLVIGSFMRCLSTQLVAAFSLCILSACSVFGDVNVKVAPYEVIETDGAFEMRHYERLVLASTDTTDGMDSVSAPFYKLFKYISGKNSKTQKIAMTAPVFMDQSGQTTEAMSFVLPEGFSLATAPPPSDPAVKLTELSDYTVVAMSFSGFLNQKSISTHRNLLQNWIADRGLKIIGKAKAAGYNPPFTLPFLRRNEILIPVKKT